MSGNSSFDEALALHQSGRIAEAEAIYRRVLHEQPDHPGALHLLGVVRQQQGDYQDALDLIGRAISINPQKAVYHNNFGAALQSLGRHEEAAACFQRALAIRPKYADGLANLGMARASLGDDAAAVASFRAALAVEPGHGEAMRQLAALVQHLGLGDEAIRLYEETLPHCSAAALAAQYRKLRVFAGRVDARRQSVIDVRAAFDGGCDITYDGRNLFLEGTLGEGCEWDDSEGQRAGEQDCVRDDLHATRPKICRGHVEMTGARSPGFSRYPANIPPKGGTTSANIPPAQTAGSVVPLVSVIVPVYNGAATIERAVGSLQAQTFSDWEALVIDDASCDGTWEVLQALAAADARIGIVRLAENGGPSAARNAGLRLARGEFIAYLDADDEYYPGYLEQLAAARDKGDVLMFGFDVVYEDGPPRDRAQDWDPRHVRRNLFAFNPVVPLAVAHRRDLLNKVGGFHELISRHEDWDLWKRMARAGAKFVFLPGKSGVYHVRPGTLSQTGRLSARQREAIMANWAAGRPILSPAATAPQASRKSARRIVFVSPHCLLDFTSQAATAALDTMQVLAGVGFQCQAFCGTLPNDDGQDASAEEVLARWKSPYVVRRAQIGPFAARMMFTAQGETPVTLFQTASPRGIWRNAEEVAAFMTACELFLKKQRPDAVWTYGDDPVSREIVKLLKRLDISIVFALHDLTHRNAETFMPIDYAVVPSEVARRHYWETLGLDCQVLPPAVDPGGEWHAERVAAVYREFFSNITHQPGPPLMPREVVKG